MVKQLYTYLIFKGNCKEALKYYEECLEGEIVSMQTFGNSPIPVPNEHKQLVFNSEFRADEIILKASDSLPENEITIGKNFALFVTFSEMEEQENVFAKLSEGGAVIMPLGDGPSGAKFGMLVDKFGIQWMLVSQN